MKGTIKWFNNVKGYGFIIPDDEDGELFAHYSSVIMDGFKTLKAKQPVTFQVAKGEKCKYAVNIVPISLT